jgi:hypothetical protein
MIFSRIVDVDNHTAQQIQGDILPLRPRERPRSIQDRCHPSDGKDSEDISLFRRVRISIANQALVDIIPTSWAAPDHLASAFLHSTDYSLTMPAFRHGQIRLSKDDLPISQLVAAVDDTLDWTAFQMAASGGAGDVFVESTDYSRPSEAELDELEELTSWFGSFGFQGTGSLVGPRTPSQPVDPGLPPPPKPTSAAAAAAAACRRCLRAVTTPDWRST